MKTRLIVGFILCSAVTARPAQAQARDSIWNGALVGGAIGAGSGLLFTHAVRDSDRRYRNHYVMFVWFRDDRVVHWIEYSNPMVYRDATGG